MKALVFANTDGNFDLLNETMSRETVETPNCVYGLCIGNLPIVNQSTPIRKFFRYENTKEGTSAKQYLKRTRVLPRFTYALCGSTDDPFVPQEEFGFANIPIIKHWQIIDILAYASVPMQGVEIPTTKTIKVGVLGGYYVPELWGEINKARVGGERSKASLALCESDFTPFQSTHIELLITFESPDTYGNNALPCGCKRITELVAQTNPKIHIHAHGRKFGYGYINGNLSVGIPALKDGYGILDLYTNNFTVKNIKGKTLYEFKYNQETGRYNVIGATV